MQALAFPNDAVRDLPIVAARARSQSEHIRPVNPRPPIRRASRRVKPSQRRTPSPRMESMVGPPVPESPAELHFPRRSPVYGASRLASSFFRTFRSHLAELDVEHAEKLQLCDLAVRARLEHGLRVL